VASLAIQVKGFHESWLPAGVFQSMAVRAAPVLRGLVCNPFPVFVNMMAFVAALNGGLLVVGIVREHRLRPLGSYKRFG
jgi:hypothetical protein